MAPAIRSKCPRSSASDTHSLGVLPPNPKSGVFCRELMAMLAMRTTAVMMMTRSQHISDVLRLGTPREIGGGAIPMVTVKMPGNQTRRSRRQERIHHQSVHRAIRFDAVPPKTHHRIRTGRPLRRHSRRTMQQTAHPTLVTNLVTALVSPYFSPILHHLRLP